MNKRWGECVYVKRQKCALFASSKHFGIVFFFLGELPKEDWSNLTSKASDQNLLKGCVKLRVEL